MARALPIPPEPMIDGGKIMIDNMRLSDLPSYGKVFVAIFTSLMLCVCLWAAFIYSVEKGMLDTERLPAYLTVDDPSTADSSPEDYVCQEEAAHDADSGGEEPQLRENVGLAHTHINGQTLLFFAIGFIFLFTSIPTKRKKIIYWLFGLSVLVHTIGLSGEGFHWFFDDILALSGVILIAVIAYMALIIYGDLSIPRGTKSA